MSGQVLFPYTSGKVTVIKTTLLKGRTSAHFHNFGTLPFLIEALKMEQIGKLKVPEQLFRFQFGISSGPVALRSFTRDSRTSTASGKIVYESGTLVTGMG